jgi:hypothetical protein
MGACIGRRGQVSISFSPSGGVAVGFREESESRSMFSRFQNRRRQQQQQEGRVLRREAEPIRRHPTGDNLELERSGAMDTAEMLQEIKDVSKRGAKV